MSRYSTYRNKTDISYEEVWVKIYIASLDRTLPAYQADKGLEEFKKRFSSEEDEFTKSLNHFEDLRRDVYESRYETLEEFEKRVRDIYEAFLKNLGYEDVIGRFRHERLNVYTREMDARAGMPAKEEVQP